jgi:hypothetical protein
MAQDERFRSEAVSYSVDLDTGEAVQMHEITLASAGLRERQDLQRWIVAHPEMIAPALLLVTTEFDRWEIRDQKVADRLDALFLDTSGAPVVAELKRDKAADTVELQALKYAAYCAQLTLDELAEEFAEYHGVELEQAHAELVGHAPSLAEGGLRSIKVRLVAGSFGPAVTSVVLWLREYGVDIGCVEVALRQVDGSRTAVLSARQLLPLPDAEDYLVRRRRKEQEEERARNEPTDWTWDAYEERLPPERVAVARRLFEQITRYVEQHQLPWTPVLRSSWLGYQRAGGFYVPVIHLRSERPIDFCVKIAEDPERLALTNPYPLLRSAWHAGSREWQWEVTTIDDVPDVSKAIDISRNYQPESGPMLRIPEGPAVSG